MATGHWYLTCSTYSFISFLFPKWANYVHLLTTNWVKIKNNKQQINTKLITKWATACTHCSSMFLRFYTLNLQLNIINTGEFGQTFQNKVDFAPLKKMTPGSPPNSPILGTIIPARIQCSSGREAPLNCSGYGWTSCVKPGYIRACCWPPRAARWYMEPWCIPSRPACCSAAIPVCGAPKSAALAVAPCWTGEEFVAFGWGDGVSELRWEPGLPPGLLLQLLLLLLCSAWDALLRSALCSTLCDSNASMRKFLDFSMVLVIAHDKNSEKYVCYTGEKNLYCWIFCCTETLKLAKLFASMRPRWSSPCRAPPLELFAEHSVTSAVGWKITRTR